VLEASLLAVAGGILGFAAGTLLAQMIGNRVFSSTISVEPVLLPFILLLSLVITWLGSAAAIRRGLRFSPAAILRGELV
jgi:putative ABC transport system permease protein